MCVAPLQAAGYSLCCKVASKPQRGCMDASKSYCSSCWVMCSQCWPGGVASCMLLGVLSLSAGRRMVRSAAAHGYSGLRCLRLRGKNPCCGTVKLPAMNDICTRHTSAGRAVAVGPLDDRALRVRSSVRPTTAPDTGKLIVTRLHHLHYCIFGLNLQQWTSRLQHTAAATQVCHRKATGKPQPQLAVRPPGA